MSCSHKQTCSICEAPFKMTKGCNLEKRCHACRFLNVNELTGDIYETRKNRSRFTKKLGHGSSPYVVYNESLLVDALSEGDFCFHTEKICDTHKDMENEETLKMIQYFLSEFFTHREKMVITYLYGLEDKGEYTKEETGKILGITGLRVGQIAISVVSKLRHPKLSRKLSRKLGD